MTELEELEKRLALIEQRNARVEADKAWETSLFRIGLIALVTYLVAAIFLLSVQLPYPLLNALVPTIGYALSTQSIPTIKHWWLRKQSNEGKK